MQLASAPCAAVKSQAGGLTQNPTRAVALAFAQQPRDSTRGQPVPQGFSLQRAVGEKTRDELESKTRNK